MKPKCKTWTKTSILINFQYYYPLLIVKIITKIKKPELKDKKHVTYL